MVGEAAHVVPCIVVVVAVAAEGGVVAEVLAVLLGGDGLVHGVHSLQDLAAFLPVQAQPANKGSIYNLQ